MDKEIYDNVGMISVQLNKLLEELEACQKEKEEILAWANEQIDKGLTQESQKEISERLDKSLQRFQKVVDKIHRLNKCV